MNSYTMADEAYLTMRRYPKNQQGPKKMEEIIHNLHGLNIKISTDKGGMWLSTIAKQITKARRAQEIPGPIDNIAFVTALRKIRNKANKTARICKQLENFQHDLPGLANYLNNNLDIDTQIITVCASRLLLAGFRSDDNGKWYE